MVRVIHPAHSPLFLPEDSVVRRLPRAPNRARPEGFTARFEDRALFYDCFWHADGARVLLVGPPPLNLDGQYQQANFTARPGGQGLAVKFHVWRSTMVTELSGVPPGTTEIQIQLADLDTTLAVQPNQAADLAGRRLMFTMNKDNELAWIAEWARYHVVTHAVDAIVLFDNGSTRYAPDELAAILADVPGLADVLICAWPYKFGALDRHVVMHRFWAHFLQNAAMTSVIRRFGEKAQALLNCDIDELVAPVAGGTIFDLVDRSPGGLVRLDGIWVTSARDPEAGDGSSHFDFQHLLRDPLRLPSPGKWLLDAKRDWARNLDVMASWHRVRNAPDGVENNAPRSGFWHFQGINSNWKSRRRIVQRPNKMLHRPDARLRAARSGYRAQIGKA